MTEENEKLQTKHKQQFWFKVGLTVIILLWLSNFLILFCHNPGTIGDSFGVVNSLFSGLAFGGIIYTIILQRDELQLQRDELSLTRLELKRSANAQEDSQKALERQAANLKKSAELSALTTLIEYYQGLNTKTYDIIAKERYNDVITIYIARISQILEDKQS